MSYFKKIIFKAQKKLFFFKQKKKSLIQSHFLCNPFSCNLRSFNDTFNLFSNPQNETPATQQKKITFYFNLEKFS